MPEITVVITSYKLERYIERCLDGLFAQTMQDFDILMIDDASPDGTVELIRRYQLGCPERLRAILLEENLGSPARTRNLALDSGLIDGRYVVFLDGYDSVEPDFLQRLHARAVETGAEVTVCAYDRVAQEDGRVLCREMTDFPALLSVPSCGDALSFINTSLWNKLFLTELLENIRFPDFSVGEDLVFLHRAFKGCTRIAATDRILIHYHVRGGSVISSTSEQTIHAFAGELSDMLSSASGPFYEMLALTTFIHIGISMPMRAMQSKSIDLRGHLRWTRAYLTDNALLSAREYLSFASLIKHGVKGAAIWMCSRLYRMDRILWFFKSYRAITGVFRFDIKF